MRISHSSAVILTCIIMLPNCGGSASSPTVPIAARGFQSQLDIYNSQIARLGANSPTTVMPTQGRAAFRGSVGISSSQGFSQPAALGTLQLNADFASSTVSGSLDGFVSPTGQIDSSPIFVKNGVVVGNQIVADVSGGNPLDQSGSNLSGSIQGMFLGAGANGIAGTMVGQSSAGVVYGRFGAERLP